MFLVKSDSTVDVRDVTVGFTQDNVSVIASGISPSDVVVTDGQDKLQQGSKIETRAGRSRKPAAKLQGAQDPGVPRQLLQSSAFRNAMNPSRLFILRPVATALLMVAIMLVGIVAYRQFRFRPCPRWTIRPFR